MCIKWLWVLDIILSLSSLPEFKYLVSLLQRCLKNLMEPLCNLEEKKTLNEIQNCFLKQYMWIKYVLISETFSTYYSFFLLHFSTIQW